jgi:hypothetical protein
MRTALATVACVLGFAAAASAANIASPAIFGGFNQGVAQLIAHVHAHAQRRVVARDRILRPR